MTVPATTKTWMPIALLFVATSAGMGCDDPFIDPYVNDGRYFTIWGFVDATATRQVVRVLPVTRTATAARAPVESDLDATVLSTEVATGVVTQWTPSVVRLNDGSSAHIFSTGARFRPGYHYTLEVRRSDGRFARADTWIPDYSPFQSVVPGEIRTDPDGHMRQEVTLKGIDSPWGIRITYLVQNRLARLVYEIPYDRKGERDADGNWVIDLDLTADQVIVKDSVRAAILRGEVSGEGGLDTPFNLHQMGIRLTLLDEDWDLPPGEIDPELFARPDEHTNVANGYGYWGSANYFDQKWLVTNQTSVALGWQF